MVQVGRARRPEQVCRPPSQCGWASDCRTPMVRRKFPRQGSRLNSSSDHRMVHTTHVRSNLSHDLCHHGCGRRAATSLLRSPAASSSALR
jgi:hypothetical protein